MDKLMEHKTTAILIAISLMWIGWVSYTVTEVDRSQDSVQATLKGFDVRITSNTMNIGSVDDSDRHTGRDEDKNIKHQSVIDGEQTRRIKRLEDIIDSDFMHTHQD